MDVTTQILPNSLRHKGSEHCYNMGYLYINSATHHANPSSPPIHLATSQHRNQKGICLLVFYPPHNLVRSLDVSKFCTMLWFFFHHFSDMLMLISWHPSGILVSFVYFWWLLRCLWSVFMNLWSLNDVGWDFEQFGGLAFPARWWN